MNSGQIQFGGLGQRAATDVREPGLGIPAAAMTVVTAIAMLHPHPLVLPLLGVILVLASLVVAAIVWLRTFRTGGPRMTQLHLAGLIMFFGFAATMLGDIDPAVKSFEALR